MNSEGAQITDTVYNGSTITYGNHLDITVGADEGYKVSWKLNNVTQTSNHVTVPVTGDVAITVTETTTLQSLEKPVISGTFTYDAHDGFYYLSSQIKNTNPRAVTASILVYANGDVLNRTWSMTIPANSTETYNHGEMFSSGARMSVTFSCNGYGDSTSSTTF
ncbi:MAG: hypothetical protein J1F66_01795 [Clostridiales bacterium]|nr:hypothetical protein [Clostridiales bacterium]